MKAAKYIKYVLLIVIISIPIFGHLDTLPIRIWDESRQAVSAYEMLNNGNYLVTQYEGNPDMWNTKPPLLVWTQVILMKLIGANELSVRLPSAIAALLTCIVMLIFLQKYTRKPWIGIIAVLVLVTSQGYLGLHSARTGDYDAMLTLFTTLAGLLYFTYCETQKNRYLYMFFVSLTLAVLTKGVVGLMFLPALLIYTLLRRQLIQLLKNKSLYLGIAFFMAFVLGYYLLREIYNPGYIEAVRNNELGGRYLNVLENHRHDFWFYLNNFIERKIPLWNLLIPCGLAIGLFIKDKKINRLTHFLLLMITTFFLIISSAQTKLEWYDVPMYPFLAIAASIFIYYIFERLENIEYLRQRFVVNVIPFIFLFLLCIVPYKSIIDTTHKPKEFYWDKEFYAIGYYLKASLKGFYDVDNKYLLFDGYNAHNLFYINLLNDKGIKISFKDRHNLSPDDVVIANQSVVKQYLVEHYNYEILQEVENVVTYKIYGNKE